LNAARAGWIRATTAALATIGLAGLASCARADKPVTDSAIARPRAVAASGPIEITDDLDKRVRLAAPARRIVSLIPSATETLIAIGATNEIAGRTRYDTASALAKIPSVGGGIDPSIEAIVGIKPDLVIAWATDTRGGLRERLASAGIQTFVMRTEDTTDIFRNIESLGRLTGRDSAAAAVAGSVRATLDSVRASVADKPTPSVIYVVFPDPPMTAGPKSFIGQLLGLVGGRTIFPASDQYWPNVPMEEIVKRDPDIVIVPVGEFRDSVLDRFRKLAGWRNLRAVKQGHVVAVSADIVSRPSPAIAQAALVLRAAVHPEFASAADSARTK
jgi:iron complex transport system substrate-binding protein